MALDTVLQRFFIWFTPILVRKWYIFVILPFLLNLILSTGLMRFKELRNTDPTFVHSPVDAPSKDEKALLNRLWPLDTDEFLPQRSFNYKSFFIVLVTGIGCSRGSENIPECNLLSEDILEGTGNLTYLDLIEQLDNEIVGQVAVKSKNGTSYNYEDLCLSWWESCVRADSLIKMLQKRDQLRDNDILITYPRSNTHATPIYLAFNLGGVRTNPKTSEINSVTAIRLNYYLRTENDLEEEIAKEWEHKAADFFANSNSASGFNKHLHLAAYYSTALQRGLQKQNDEVAPRFGLAIGLLIVFATICCMKTKHGEGCRVDWVKSKTIMAFAGIVTAAMGIASGFGFSLLMGVPISGVSVVVPFLIISVGVDDMFIILNAWHHCNKPGITLIDRMTLTTQDAAVAITITSITDALSFFVGCSTKIPSVQWFCFYAAMCIIFNYLYQITFFVGLLTVTGKWELEGRHSLAPCASRKGISSAGDDTNLSETANGKHRLKEENKISLHSTSITDTENVHICRKYYGPFLLHPITQAFVCLLLVFYLVVSIIGCQYLKEGLEYSDLLLRNDPTIDYVDTANEYFNEGWQCEITVSKSPDLTNPVVRNNVLKMVEDFESSSYAMGKNGTQFWMRNYYDFLNETQTYIQNNKRQWVNGVYNFVNRFSFQKTWKQDVAWENKFDASTRSMTAFRFRLGLTFDFNQPDKQKVVVVDLRRIAAKYSEWGVSTYGGYIWDQVDQYLVVRPNTLQNVGIALAAMIVVSLLLIPVPICTLWITLAIISIDLGVVGFMSWWDVNLDPISMITIVMSIGFSVDFAAHITYGYVSHPDPNADPRERTISSLERLGYPLFQAAMSSVLGVSVLSTVNSEMVLIFLKTVVLVIIFGMLHALVFLPVLLNLTMPYLQKTCLYRISRNSDKNTFS